MSLHTGSTFWEALRRIIPNLPERDVTQCVITVLPLALVRVELTMYVRDEAGRPEMMEMIGISGELGPATHTRRFRIVPDEDPA